MLVGLYIYHRSPQEQTGQYIDLPGQASSGRYNTVPVPMTSEPIAGYLVK